MLFSVGAVIPIFPFLVPVLSAAVILSLVISSVAPFGIGAAITIFTDISVWRSGSRQLLLGLAAAAFKFAIGHLIGVILA